MTLSYEVTIVVHDRALVEAFESYMRDVHVPEVVGTGCFVDGRFEKASSGVYRSRYTVPSQVELERYLGTFAEALRGDFRARFPDGVTLSREVWETVARV